jgi:prevent-host-death family protein
VKTLTVVQAKSRFSAVLAEVEAGEEVAVTRHGKVVAKIVPDAPHVAASAFSDFWADQGIEMEAPKDMSAEDVASLDDE